MGFRVLARWAAIAADRADFGADKTVENECPLVANTNPLSSLWQHPPRGGGDKSKN